MKKTVMLLILILCFLTVGCSYTISANEADAARDCLERCELVNMTYDHYVYTMLDKSDIDCYCSITILRNK